MPSGPNEANSQMAIELDHPKLDDPTLVRGGPSHHLARRLGLEPPTLSRRLLKVGLLILLTWGPLVLLSLLQGGRVAIPLLHDPVIYSRFLFVVPLLELAHIVVGASLGVQTRHFLESGLVLEPDRPAFESARAAAIRLRGSITAEVVL